MTRPNLVRPSPVLMRRWHELCAREDAGERCDADFDAWFAAVVDHARLAGELAARDVRARARARREAGDALAQRATELDAALGEAAELRRWVPAELTTDQIEAALVAANATRTRR